MTKLDIKNIWRYAQICKNCLYCYVTPCAFPINILTTQTLTSTHRLLTFSQIGRTCRSPRWARSLLGVHGVPPNRCADGLVIHNGRCYSSCPNNTQVVGPGVCWEASSRGHGAPTVSIRKHETVNRGAEEIELIQSKFQPLSRSEMTECQTNPNAIAV